MVEAVRAEVLAGIPHGFLTRKGGVSSGVVAGLQVGHGAGDDPAAVAENRRKAIGAVLPGTRLVTVHQVHGAACVRAGVWEETERPHADALVTAEPGMLLGVLTADCAPVLLADRKAGIVAAAHAGWKGAVAGVTESAIAAMERLGARRERITAAIGPCIAQASYEVDDGFRARFSAEDTRFFAAGRPGHWHFDLEAYVAHRLERSGIGTVERLGRDTYADEARFFSFRRATHRGEPDYGRQIALIGLPI